jgi:TonB family protein
MKQQRKGEYIGVLGALLVHVALIALLLLLRFAVPRPDEGASGVPVMLGNVEAANGFDDPSLVKVDVLPEETDASPQPAKTLPEPPSDQDLMTQNDEETIALKPEKKKTPKAKETSKSKVETKKAEKSAAEKAAEAKRQAEANAEHERQAAAEAAQRRVAGAFGRGAKMEGNRGSAATGTGTEGSREGNGTTGAKNGSGGYGTFDLGGRSLGTGGLPRPAYRVQEEGKVVVNITVNPAGAVIATGINLSYTNTQNPVLRKAAEEAARKARFNAVDEMNNQVGTITYYFNLR